MVQALRFDVLAQELHLSMERWMVVLEGQDVLRALLRDGLDNVFLTSYRIDRHDGAFHVSHLQQLGDGRVFHGHSFTTVSVDRHGDH
jgi:hypothetical protein